MIDYKHIRDSGKSFWDYSSIESEVQHLSRKMNYGIDEILSAIQEVGMDRDEIRDYIEDRRNRMF
jgi:hypothetical protein